eukprot:1190442-Prorocentrum_minimum.AAC.6
MWAKGSQTTNTAMTLISGDYLPGAFYIRQPYYDVAFSATISGTPRPPCFTAPLPLPLPLRMNASGVLDFSGRRVKRGFLGASHQLGRLLSRRRRSAARRSVRPRGVARALAIVDAGPTLRVSDTKGSSTALQSSTYPKCCQAESRELSV